MVTTKYKRPPFHIKVEDACILFFIEAEEGM